MKRLLLLMLGALFGASCATNPYGEGIPASYVPLLDAALEETPRADSLRMLLRETPRAEREAMAYLIAWMPRGDRDTMSLELLRENVHYACLARKEYPWAKSLPDSVFLNEVLPYAVVDEVRDSWRADFYERFAPCVAGCTTLREAFEVVNRNLRDRVQVDYNTLREKTNQSPAESMRQHMASCTGLSVLLVDALRAVGVPARFAGTAAWHDNRGNHSWTEVWLDGEWRFAEYYYAGLDEAWFLPDAGKASPDDRAHAIYAVSFRPTGDWFPMVWSESSREVHAVNVSQRYVDLYAARESEQVKQGTHVWVSFRMFRDARHASESGGRVAANVDVFNADGLQVGGGRTAGPTQDMNDVLKFLLEKNRSYLFRYTDGADRPVEMKVEVGDTPVTVDGYWE